MLILRGKKPSIFKMLTLVQDSNANAKEILDLVLWLEFKIGHLLILIIPLPIFCLSLLN